MRDAVTRHYGRRDPAAAILDHLRRQGVDLRRLTQAELAQYDEFHIGGARSTRELAKLAGLESGRRVLDVGSGVGGPARLLAVEFGCRVTGLDVTEAFHRSAVRLTELVGLGDRVGFRLGSALAMPFEAASFDVVWLQHCDMNIPQKDALFAECRRVLVPRGVLALHEIFAGAMHPIHFPVPWASDPSQSALVPADEARALIARAGLAEVVWRDTTANALAFFKQLDPGTMIEAFFTVGEMREVFGNMIRNIEEGLLTMAMGVFKAPGAPSTTMR